MALYLLLCLKSVSFPAACEIRALAARPTVKNSEGGFWSSNPGIKIPLTQVFYKNTQAFVKSHLLSVRQL